MKRRDAIKYFMSGLILPLVPARLQAAAAQSGRRLVLIELSGANDGLNTVIPYRDDRYYRLRPNLAIRDQDRFQLDDHFALHNSLKDLGSVWENGELAIVHGLGYPGANRSHFKSIALWETGGDGTSAGRSGWLTEDIENMGVTQDWDAHGISLDGGMGVFTSPNGVWLSMTSAAQFQRLSTSSFSVASTTTDNPALAALLGRAEALDTSMKRISSKMNRSRSLRFDIRGGDLGRQMGTAASLIAAGIDTPVLKVKIDGFDTHENQFGRHRNLLRDLGRSIGGFASQMRRINEWDNTLVMTYSEFGRRAIENFTDGTDHGTAAPHFIAGGRVNGGFYSDHPNLGKLIEGDLQFTMDYRSVYEMVLSAWFGIDQNRFTGFRNTDLSNLLEDV